MKAKPAVFFAKHPRWAIMALMFSVSLAQAQSPGAPGAVQQPYYRQPGSAYVPPGTTQRAPQARLPAAPAPTRTQGYQPGFGTPPNQAPSGYKPPTIKGTSANKPKVSGVKNTQSKPVSLESKVARLEKNDAHQDRRLGNLERGQGVTTIEGGGSYLPETGKTYTVRPGDTLWRIADKHSTSINAIKSANRLSGETISVGQTIRIPGHGNTAVFAESNAASSHTVRPGDTFSQIAQAHGVSQDALARANPSAYPDRLLVGERLTIPGKGTSAGSRRASAGSSLASAPSSRSHLVKRGESLGAIAKMHGVSTASVAAANKLKNSNLIEPGQRLIIPGGGASRPAPPSPTYPAADSDTVPLPGASLMAEQQAPAPMPSSAPALAPAPAYEPLPKAAPPTSSNRRGIVAYRLERGDDINTVAALFNTTPEKIREMNKLPADRKLKEGEEVVVPSLGAVSLN